MNKQIIISNFTYSAVRGNASLLRVHTAVMSFQYAPLLSCVMHWIAQCLSAQKVKSTIRIQIPASSAALSDAQNALHARKQHYYALNSRLDEAL